VLLLIIRVQVLAHGDDLLVPSQLGCFSVMCISVAFTYDMEGLLDVICQVGEPAASRLVQCALLMCIEKWSYSVLSIQVSKYHANVIVNHVLMTWLLHVI
jgi:hypothetical protein